MESFYRKYEKVFGYKPSALDLREMERFVTQIGIKENDALLLFFLFQEKNLRRLSDIPAEIEKAGAQVEKTAKARCDAVLQQSINHVAPQLVERVGNLVQVVLADRERLRFTHGVLVAAFIALLSLLAVAGGGYLVGYERAETWSHREMAALEMSEAALKTPEGRRVMLWYLRAPEAVREVMTCSNLGWKIKGDRCFPHLHEDGKVYGWRI